MSREPCGLLGLGTAALASCVLLAGCGAMGSAEVAEPELPAAPATRPAQPPAKRALLPSPRVSDAEILLSYFGQLRKLAGPELAREHDAARQAYNTGQSDYNRVRLAMVKTLPNTPFHDDPRALELLEPLTKDSDSQLSGLASLLVCQIQERQRLDAGAQALQQKLDALKSLERSLIERRH